MSGSRVARAVSTSLLASFLFVGGALTAPRAFADPTEAELAAARILFEEALALEDAGRWEDALERVKKVASVKTTAAVRFHLALCNEKLGHLVAAFNEFGRAEADAAAEASPDSQRIEANSQKHASELKERIPTVILHTPPGVADLRVRIDGAPVGSALFGAPIPLDPGAHVVDADAAGYAPFSERLELEERARERTVDLRLVQRREDVPAPARASSSPWPWITLGVGATSLAAAGVMYGLRASAISDLDAACAPGRTQCPDDKSDLHQRGKTYNLMGNVLLGVGVVAVGTSVALFVLAPSKERSGATSGVAAEVVVSVGSLGLRGRF